jgi:hypothetical protein
MHLLHLRTTHKTFRDPLVERKFSSFERFCSRLLEYEAAASASGHTFGTSLEMHALTRRALSRISVIRF